jgi:hypothetical protein
MRPGVLVALATAAVALLATPAAEAAFAAQLRVKPSVVDVGRVVRIELRAFSLDGGIRRPDDQSGLRLRVEAVSPEGRVVRVGLRHAARGVWRGTYRFRTAGKWQLRIGNWPKGAHGPRLFVTVRELAEPPPSTNPFAPGSGAAAFAGDTSSKHALGDGLVAAAAILPETLAL